jgi:hypothetical protein
MPQQNSATLSFNRGVLSTLGLARVDLTRYRMAAKTMVNWMARVLGSMMLRPGSAYIGTTAASAQARSIPFVFAATDTAILEVTQGTTRVWVNDALVTRVAVGTQVTNGTFAANLAGWTNSSDPGCSVNWVSAGVVSFIGTGTNDAVLDQELTIAAPDQAKRHALRIVVLRGPLTVRLGSSQGDDSLINETALNVGTHSLAFTPGAANVWIRFFSSGQAASQLASCVIEGAGILTLPTPWQATDLQSLRWSQSADVIFVGCPGYAQQQFERRATDSWSIVDYTQTCIDGPFRAINISNVTLIPSAITGDIALTASKPLFKAGHVGALFRMLSVGQTVQAALAAASTFTNPVLVTGVGSQRTLTIQITGVWVGTVTLQYSPGSPNGPWIDTSQHWAGNVSTTWADGNDNQSIYYRIGFDAGNYTSGAATCLLSFPAGSITGIVRITGFTNSTQVNAAVLEALGGTAATTLWYEGYWSGFRGYPGTPVLWQGRLWWFGTSIFGSVSDAYNSFDDTITGGSAPIIGQLGSGPVDNIYWAIGLQQLVIGTASAETSIRSTYLGDAITPTNFNTLTGSTQGGANVNALQIDRSGIFVQVSGQRVFSLDLDIYTYSYKSQELTLLVPDFNAAGIVQIAFQNKPDRRLHCIRADGSVGVLVWDPVENVLCWLEVIPASTVGGAGVIEDVAVLPGVNQAEDNVYYTVRRVVNGTTVRYREKWAFEGDCTGLPVAKHVDSHVAYAGAASANLAGIAPQLAGETVCVWGWNTASPYVDGNGNKPGLDLGTYKVAADGSVNGITFEGASYPVTNAVIGLGYIGQWESMKQAFAAAMGTPLNQPKRIPRLGLILQNTHAQGIRVGNDFNHLDDLPLDDLPRLSSAAGALSDTNAILNDYDQQMSAFDDLWSTDSRVCLEAASPRPCTVLAFTVELDTSG